MRSIGLEVDQAVEELAHMSGGRPVETADIVPGGPA